MNSNQSTLLEQLGERYDDFLCDESRKRGWAEFLSFPQTENEVASVLEECARRRIPVTLQGARTGITAGATPNGGAILNLSKMNRVLDVFVDEAADRVIGRVQPGVLLKDWRAFIERGEWKTSLPEAWRGREFFFPPDPTESTASLGGMIACNASGALSFRYGPTRPYVLALRLVLPDGRRLTVRRGVQRARGRAFELECDDGSVIRGALPSYRMPRVKNAAGYFAQDDMDLVDLFVGSEGTLGVVTEAELMLRSAPPVRWGVMGFLEQDGSIASLVEALRHMHPRPAALEYFDANSLDLVRQSRNRVAALQTLPELQSGWKEALYVELHADDEDQAVEAFENVAELFQSFGISDRATWTATDARQMQKLRELRHAVPEQVNARIAELQQNEPQVTKLGTDMAVPEERLADVLRLYRQGLESEKLYGVQFGHIGDTHVHVNILPRNNEEYQRGRQMYLRWARQVIAWGGTISAEHGVGKLKVELLREMYGAAGVTEMLAVKRLFDSEQRLGCGTLFGAVQTV